MLLLAVLYLLPLIALLVPLLLGRFPGERQLVRLRRRLATRRPRAPRAQAPARARPRPFAPRGGLLIATALAVRPPPAG